MNSKRLKLGMTIAYYLAYNLSEQFWCALKNSRVIYGQT